ncbi:MAG: YdbH domain-containing protein [Magnetococcales bacterium]|nr:YdbH domain-containing protein [Magnetococcales bacterium]
MTTDPNSGRAAVHGVKRRRRGRLLFFGLFLAIFGLILGRNPLLHQGIPLVLLQAGLPQASVGSVDLGFTGFQLRKLSIPQTGGFDHLQLAWSWRNPIHLPSLQIDHLYLKGTLAENGFILNGLKGPDPTQNSSPTAADSPTQPLNDLPTILARYWPGEVGCNRCRIEVKQGGIIHQLAFDLLLKRPSRESQPQPTTTDDATHNDFINGHLHFNLASQTDGPIASKPLTGQLTLALSNLFKLPQFNLTFKSQVTLSHPAIQAASIALPPLSQALGGVEINIQSSGQLPIWSQDGRQLDASFHLQSRSSTQIDWSIRQLTLPTQGVTDLSSSGTVSVQFKEGELTTTLDAPLALAMDAGSTILAIPPPLRKNFKNQVRLTLSPNNQPPSVRWRPEWSLPRLDGGFDLELASHSKARLQARFKLAGNNDQPLQLNTPKNFKPVDFTLKLTHWQADPNFTLANLQVKGHWQMDRPQAWRLKTQFNGMAPRLQATDWSMNDVQLKGSTDLDWTDGQLHLRLEKPATLDLHQINGPPLKKEIQKANLTLNKTADPLLVWQTGTEPRFHLQLAASYWPVLLKQASGKGLALQATLPKLTVSGTPQQIVWQLQQGGLLLPDLKWKIEQLHGRGLFKPRDKRIVGDLKIGKISSQAATPWVTPLTLAIDFKPQGPHRQGFHLHLGQLDSTALALIMDGEINLQSQDGSADIKLDPVLFGPDQLKLSALSPQLAKQISDLSGTVSYHGKIRWNQAGDLDGDGQLRLQDISATAAGIQVHQLDSTINLTGPQLSLTPGGQRITVKEILAGLPVKNIELTFQSLADRHIDLQGAGLHVLGGTVTADPGLWQLTPPAGKTVVRITALDLAKISELIQVEGIELTGHLSGQLPIEYTAKGGIIPEGFLKTDHPGLIRLSGQLVTGIAEQSGIPAKVIQALENFNYQTLSITISRDHSGEYLVLLSGRGHNPKMDKGRPIELNVTLSGRLDDILRKILSLQERVNRVNQILSTPGEPK